MAEAAKSSVSVKLDFPYPLDLYTLVPHLLDLHPGWDEFDIKSFVEAKSRMRLGNEDFQTLRSIFTRVVLVRTEFEG